MQLLKTHQASLYNVTYTDEEGNLVTFTYLELERALTKFKENYSSFGKNGDVFLNKETLLCACEADLNRAIITSDKKFSEEKVLARYDSGEQTVLYTKYDTEKTVGFWQSLKDKVSSITNQYL